jgi:tyrosinase
VWASTAFGGNGAEGTRCIPDGPFANFQVNIPEPHCLQRHFGSSTVKPDSTTVEALFADPTSTYGTFEFSLENGPHSSIHLGTGGGEYILAQYLYAAFADTVGGLDMIPAWSPNDPIFFLHHTNIDRLWWRFQTSSPNHKLEYNGRKYRFNWSNPSDPQNTIVATAQDNLPMAGFAPDVLVQDVMETEGGLNGELCYKY